MTKHLWWSIYGEAFCWRIKCQLQSSNLVLSTGSAEARLANYGCVSFPESTLVCPWYIRIALTSLKGFTWVSPSALLVKWVTWGWPQVHDVITWGWVIVQLALLSEWAPRGRYDKANRPHPLWYTCTWIDRTHCDIHVHESTAPIVIYMYMYNNTSFWHFWGMHVCMRKLSLPNCYFKCLYLF